MFCQNCGNQVADGQKFCEHCGAPVENAVVKEVVEEVVEETVPVQEPVEQPASSYDSWAQEEPASYSAPATDYQSTYTGNPYVQAEPVQSGGKGLSVASMICGILSICCCCVGLLPIVGWLPIIPAIVAVVLGIIAMAKGASGKGMAITGLICGAIGLILAIVVLAAGAAVLSDIGGLDGLDPDSIMNMLNL